MKGTILMEEPALVPPTMNSFSSNVLVDASAKRQSAPVQCSDKTRNVVVSRGLGHASPIPLQLPRPDHRARNPPFQDWPHSGDCSNNNEQDEPEQPPIMSPSLALLSGLFLDNPVPRFHIFGGVHNTPPLQYLTRLRQPLFLKFPAALYSDYYGHDPSTVERPILTPPPRPYLLS